MNVSYKGMSIPESDITPLEKISSLVLDWTGNQITDKNMSMLLTKLTNRMQDLNLKSISEYHKYFTKNMDSEKDWLISCFTIHHTYFFREYEHFNFLKKVFLEFAETKKPLAKLRILSAACSNGAEAYSIAMFLDDLCEKNKVNVDFEIIGIDVDKKILEIAENGVYRLEEVKKIPLELLSKYWLKGSGDISSFVKIKDSIKKRCKFMVGSLLDKNSVPKNFNLIFCRNVYIYFSPDQVRSASENLLSGLVEDGHLIIGLSETLKGLDLSVKSIGNSIYQKTKGASVVETVKAKAKDLIRVFVIDDSPVVSKLLASVLTESDGFKVVGSASNGEEAKEKLDKAAVDIVTLDIHMPVLDGIGYLTKYFGADHPPVVMITSVDRSDSELALKAMELGASDFIEKPSMSRLTESGSEIKSKIRYIFDNKSKSKSIDLSLEKNLKTKEVFHTPVHKMIRVVLARDDENVTEIVSLVDQFRVSIENGPIVIASESNIEAITKVLKQKLGDQGYKFSVLTFFDDFSPNTIYFASLHKTVTSVAKISKKNSVSVMVLSSALSLDVLDNLKGVKGSVQLLLEEPKNNQIKKSLEEFATDLTQATSFDYLSRKFLCK